MMRKEVSQDARAGIANNTLSFLMQRGMSMGYISSSPSILFHSRKRSPNPNSVWGNCTIQYLWSFLHPFEKTLVVNEM